MATEPADGVEVSVTISPHLEEWLDDRAEALGVDSDEVLVQLLGTYRAAADLDDDALPVVLAGADDDGDLVDESDLVALEERLGRVESDATEGVESLESDLEESVEDIRNRVLQLRDAIRDTAPEDHSHREFPRFETQFEDLSADLEEVTGDVEDLLDRVRDVESGLAETDERLTRVVAALLSLREESCGGPDAETLQDLKRVANRTGTTRAACAACGTAVTIGLLTAATCPHCDTGFDDLDLPESGLGRALGLRKPKLVRQEPSSPEAGDE